MPKIVESEIVCRELEKAFDEAVENAYNADRPIPSNINWDSNEHGNSVSTKGALTGSADCKACGKHCSVTIQLDQIEAKSVEDRKPVKLYSLIGGKVSISVSGHKCTKNEDQR